VSDILNDAVDYLDENGSEIDDIIHNVIDATKDDEDSAEIVTRYFKRLVDEHGDNGLPIKNTTCITRHCTGQIAACIGDKTCRENMNCAGRCPKMNTTCTLQCSESYQTPVVNDMMKCLYADHQCLWLPTPDPLNNATCRVPTDTVESVADDKINGNWYIVRGFNPLYDCYQCQKSKFVVQDGKIDYSALFNMKAVNGTEIWPTAEMTGEDRSQPGKLEF